MGGAIRENLRNVLAVLALVAVAAATTYAILQQQRLRIPVLDEVPFELKAEFEDAGAVVPGQGQTVRVAGVKVGDVAEVELSGGVGVVTFHIDRDYLPIYRDATVLLRPTTGLEDMFFQLDPGTRAAGEYEEEEVIPVANTAPDVELHEILGALDADTRAYLRLLLAGTGKGLEGRGEELGRLLGGLGPINRALDRLNSEVAKRKRNLARLVHNLGQLTERIGRADEDVLRFVTASNAALGAIAGEDPDVRRAVRLLGPTLTDTRRTLEALDDFGRELGPAFNSLRPFARNLDELNASVRELASEATPVIAERIRPFVRSAREPVPDLRRAAERYAAAAPRLTAIGGKVNRLANMAAFNPNGAEPVGTPGRAEGYLYWAAWLGHQGTQVFDSADGNGFYRHIYFTAGCSQLRNMAASSPLAPLVTGAGPLLSAACPPQ